MKVEFMKHAIEIAKKGVGHTNPNPLVGAVIVKDNRIIGEGYHKVYGGPHAEVNAFKNASEDVSGATLYVTLEPCSHFGKTPPCADLIIKKGIAKVVVGMVDPNVLVAGNGISLLKKKGVEVEVGVLEDEIRKLNEIFIKYITTRKPFCISKTGMTLDGKTATVTGQSKWITSVPSREYVHAIRHQVAGIMVGIGTVIADDPSLTTRLKDGNGSDPIRIIVDSCGRIPLEAKVLTIESTSKTIVATTKSIKTEKKEALEKMGVKVLVLPSKDNQVDLKVLMIELGRLGIDSILLEGGSTLNFSALEEGIIDKVVTIIAPKILGGEKAKTPVGGHGIHNISDAFLLEEMSVSLLGKDILIKGYIKKEGV